jgi:replication factor C subunit 1
LLAWLCLAWYRESGFHVIELNASDVRNKAALESVLGQVIDNRGVDEFYSASSARHQSHPSVLIMDEVDGIAGNEDRGGLQQLVQLIKRSRIPIVCIANDASSPKIRTLKQYALQLIWRRPTAEQIAPRLTAIAQAEGLQVDVNAMRRLIESTQADIRQCINFLQMFSQTQRRLDFDSVLSSMQGGAGKDFDVGVFEIVPRFFRDPGRQQAGWMEERSNLYFIDSGLVPLFVQELYLKGRPRLEAAAGRTEKQQSVQAMAVVSQAADFISDADTLNSMIYGEQDYSFMPTHALLSSVAPAFLMSGGGGVSGGLGFPVWLGKNSTRMKNARLCREMRTALAVTAPAPSSAFATEFLPALRAALVLPFKSPSDPSATVAAVIEEMDELGLVREDWDTVKELTDPLAPHQDIISLDAQVKTKFTKAWKAGNHIVRVNRTAVSGEKVTAGAAAVRVAEDELEEEADDAAESSAEEAEDEQQEGKEGDAAVAALKKNPMIKEARVVIEESGEGSGGADLGKRGRGGRGGRGAGRGSAGKGSRGRGGGRGKTAARGGGRGRGRGRGKQKSSKDERSDDDEDGDEMADFIVDDDDDVI